MNPKNRRLLIAIALAVLLYGYLKTNTYEFKRESGGIVLDSSKDAATGQIDAIIEKLVACESGGNPNAYHPKDGDGTDSVGILQFKVKTFVHYALAYDLFPYADAAELPNLWNDPDAQIKVAKEMIRRDRNNLYNWKVCSKRNNLI